METDLGEMWSPSWFAKMAGIFCVVNILIHWIATLAWRSALRDTNLQKRRYVLTRLGRNPNDRYLFIGFLHPYCNAGGGGERVLFEAIRHHQQADADVICVVYTGDLAPLPGGVPKGDILAKVQERFNIQLDDTRVHFLPLLNRKLVDGTYWRCFTMLGQAFGANRLGYAALNLLVPDVFIDTTGYAFALPPVKNFSRQIRVGAYVHYPTISSDMINRVWRRESGYANASWIATSWPFTLAKLLYYYIYAAHYGAALRSADAIVTNSSWTYAHIAQLLPYRMPRFWKAPRLPALHIVPPPCDTSALASLPLEGRQTRCMVSLSQFRPEKDHALQLRIVRALLDKHPELKRSADGQRALRLVVIGSCRNAEDEERLAGLKELAHELAIQSYVEWHVNAPFRVIVEKLGSASIGLSTMVDEHFGINVVEFMAAGLLTLSHASAGPLQDIAVPVDGLETGFHASSMDEYVEVAYRLMLLPPASTRTIRSAARQRAVTAFGTDAFARLWRKYMWDVLVPPELLLYSQKLLKQREVRIRAMREYEEEERAREEKERARAITEASIAPAIADDRAPEGVLASDVDALDAVPSDVQSKLTPAADAPINVTDSSQLRRRG